MSQNEGTGQGGQTRSPGGRPGAMTVAMQAVNIKPVGPKVLRIGVIQGGKIVEERIIRKRETVSIGSSERNHFVLNAAGVSSRFELFQLVGQDYILNFTEGMSGRVGLPAGVQTLEQLRGSGAARNAGSHWQVKLNDTARGKVVVGDVTLLFQFVVPPPVQPRPQLPAAARGGFAKSIDWMFTAFVLFSFMAHFGFVVYLENADWPIQDGLAAIPKSVYDLVIPTEPPPVEEPVPEDTNQPATDEPAPEPTKQPPNDSGGGGKENSGGGKAGGGDDKAVGEKTASLVAEASATAEALLVGALSAEGGGALANVLAGGAVTGNAEDVLATAAGVNVASSGGGSIRPRPGSGSGSGTGNLGALGAAGTGKPGGVGEGGPGPERTVSGRVTAESVDDVGGSGDFDSKKVTATVKQRLGAIKACYERQLRANPGLAGKVVIDFTIEQSGTVSKATATTNTTNNGDVASCIVGVFRAMRWNPGPEGGSVSYSYPFVFAPMS